MKGMVWGIMALGALAGTASAQTPASSTFKGDGVYCFEIGGHEGENFQHLKLAMEDAEAPPPYSIFPVHAVVRGQLDGVHYTNQFAGTAMERPLEGGGTGLSIGLVGNGLGINPAGAPEIWMFHYSLDLDPRTLVGTLSGIETQSKGMQDGAPVGIVANIAIIRALTPTSCETEF